MAEHGKLNIDFKAPRTSIQQICNYIAIAETKNPAESLRELILHTLLTFEEEKTSSVQEVSGIMKTMFGVDAPIHQVQEALDQLITIGHIHQPMSSNYVLTAGVRAEVKERIDRASKLQERVKMQWLEEISGLTPELDAELAWAALQDYLAKAFLRHGIQVAVFFDPSVELPTKYAESLSTLLTKAVQTKFDPAHQESAKHAISDFFVSVGKNSDRAQFVTECADGASNYFSLVISPEVAAQLLDKLKPLTLFCDTNFLFDILDFHVHPLVEVSNHLLKTIDEHKLPLNLRYHETTLRELQASISHYTYILKRNDWSRALSRAATTSRFMSGIESKYHQKNAESGIDVETFIRPYKHVDVLLNQFKIKIYRSSSSRLIERASLEADYKDFLEIRKKGKLHELIAHDVTVLDCVQSIQSKTDSTLESGALFVTCDYTLYQFDSAISRKSKAQASVVLPNVLWQILRSYIPASLDFNRSFAETFAIPEFRTIGSGTAKACSKMLGLLAAYKDFPEETATRLLSNDLLLDNLRVIKNDKQFQARVESEIALENQSLLEERAGLEQQVKNEKERRREDHIKNAKKQSELKQDLYATRQELKTTKKNVEKPHKTDEIPATLVQDAESSTDEHGHSHEKYLKSVHKMSILAGLSFAALVILIFEIAVHLVPWQWLVSHKNSLPLKIGADVMIIFAILGTIVKDWRKWCWGVGGLTLLATTISQLGG